MQAPVIHVDFNNADASGRVRLNTVAALADIETLEEPLSDGMRVRLIDDDLSTIGTAMFSPADQMWLAAVDWELIR
ncbi:MAG TPA: hypothetical protein VFH54_10110 [Mycobacteriales bacterium]|nr:hypothetical protein [Mycobacteriales bacterium]